MNKDEHQTYGSEDGSKNGYENQFEKSAAASESVGGHQHADSVNSHLYKEENGKPNSAQRFFKKYFTKSLLIILLFVGINLLLALCLLMAAAAVSHREESWYRYNMQDIAHLFQSGNQQAAEEALAQSGNFAFFINPEGHITESARLPEALNHDYTLADVASMTRWFAEDYPVRIFVQDDGSLFVYGLAKDTYARYDLLLPVNQMQVYLVFIPIVFFINLLLFLFLQWYNTKSVDRAVSPVLSAINNLSEGRPVNLNEQGTLSDVEAELNRASALERRREMARADWISGVSHDIRTPLTVIACTAEALLQEHASCAEDCARIRLNVLKIQTLVNALNLENRLDSSTAPVTLVPVSAADCFREAVVSFMNANDMENYPLSFEAEDERAVMMADTQLLSRLTDNVLANSLLHNPEGCHIHVAITTDVSKENGDKPAGSLNTQGAAETIVVSFHDDGAGAGEDAKSSTGTQDSGSPYAPHGHGLGLIRRIAALHGAKAEMGTAPDGGFYVCLRFRRSSADSFSASSEK